LRLIFLDFDGVICNASTYADWSKVTRTGSELDAAHLIDTECAARVQRIVEALDAQIIVCSSWRHAHNINMLRAMLTLRGIGPGCVRAAIPRRINNYRGTEIAQYIAEKRIVLDDILILEDDPLTKAPELIPRQVRPSFRLGLTDTHVEQALALFGVVEGRKPTA